MSKASDFYNGINLKYRWDIMHISFYELSEFIESIEKLKVKQDLLSVQIYLKNLSQNDLISIAETLKNQSELFSLKVIGVFEEALKQECQIKLEGFVNTLSDIPIKTQKLELEYLDVNSTEVIIKMIRKFNNLACLELRYGKIGSESITKVFNTLKIFNNIKVLRISDQDMGNEGAKALSELISANDSINNLMIYRNGVTFLGFKNIQKALEINKSLTFLGSQFNEIGSDKSDLEHKEYILMASAIKDQLKLNSYIQASTEKGYLNKIKSIQSLKQLCLIDSQAIVNFEHDNPQLLALGAESRFYEDRYPDC